MSEVKKQVLAMQKTIARYFAFKGFAVARECGLPTVKVDRHGNEYTACIWGNRRADIIGINKKKEVVIVETKSSNQDFNSDKKWKEYLRCCNKFYFASHKQEVCDYIVEKLKEDGLLKQVGVILFKNEPRYFTDTGIWFVNGAKNRECDLADEIAMRMVFRLSPFSYQGKYIGCCFDDLENINEQKTYSS